MSGHFYYRQREFVHLGATGDLLNCLAYNWCRDICAGGKHYHLKRDHAAKAGEHQGQVHLVPAGAPEWMNDPVRCWLAAERMVTWDESPARVFLFGIPRELPIEQRLDFAQYCVLPWYEMGMVVTADVHSVMKPDGEHVHCHCIVSNRRVCSQGFQAERDAQWDRIFSKPLYHRRRRRFRDRQYAWLKERGFAGRVYRDNPPANQDAEEQAADMQDELERLRRFRSEIRSMMPELMQIFVQHLRWVGVIDDNPATHPLPKAA